MNLHEYQAKHLLLEMGLPIPDGRVCGSPQESVDAASKIGGSRWMVKCQVHAGGRGKAGGIELHNSLSGIHNFAQKWLGRNLVTAQTDASGRLVSKILVESASDIASELYLGMLVDRSIHRVIFMVSTEGGVGVEKAAGISSQIHKAVIDPTIGPQAYQARELAFKLALVGEQIRPFTDIFLGMSKIFNRYDLALLEINPLAVTSSGHLMCLDCKAKVDPNALYRQPRLRKMFDSSQEDRREVRASKQGLNYVALEGNIGCMVNGAGLAMGTIDMINARGGKPANFLDVSGAITEKSVIEAFKIILSDDRVETILVNIFGGIVRCDLIADGIVNAMYQMNVRLPVVVRLEGNNARLGAEILVKSSLNITVVTSLEEATERVISLARRR